MRQTTTTLFALSTLLLGFALLQMGNALQGTLLAVRAGLEGFSATSTGLVMSGFYAGMCLGSVWAGRLIEQAGHIRVFAALASLGSAAALMHLLLINPAAWIIVRTITGFCFAGLIIVVESWLNAASAPETRGRTLSLYSIASMGAGIIGQLLFTIAEPSKFTLFVLVSILMSVALVPISLSRVSAPIAEGDQENPSVRRLWEFSPFGAIAMLLLGATYGAFYGLAPLYAQRVGLDQSQIALLMAAFVVGGVALQYPVGSLSDRVNRRLVVIAVAAVASALLAILALSGAVPAWVLLAAFAAIGAMILPAHSVVIAHVNDRAPVTALLAVAGGLVLMMGIGAAIGPVVAGIVMEHAGPAGLLLFIAALQGSIALYGLFRIYLVEGPSFEEKGTFAPAPITPVVAELEIGVYEEVAIEAEIEAMEQAKTSEDTAAEDQSESPWARDGGSTL